MSLIEHTLGLRSGNVRVVVQPPLPEGESYAVCAFIFGDVKNDCLVRIHSRCLYGDVFASQECDCGPQLARSIELIERRGSGIVIYLEQEGRGAGILAKAMAYRYSEDSGADTFSAYEALHLPLDDRSYDAAATLVKRLGLSRVSLLTNNPSKITGLERNGVSVRRETLHVPVAASAAKYLETKRRHGHLFGQVKIVSDPAIARTSGRHRAPGAPLRLRRLLRTPIDGIYRLLEGDRERVVTPAIASIRAATRTGNLPALLNDRPGKSALVDNITAVTVKFPRVTM